MAGRNHDRITDMEQKWLEARADGMSPVEAARVAGYKDPYNAAHRLTRSRSLIQMNQAVMVAHGVDMPLFVQTLKDCLFAMRTVKVGSGREQYTEEVPDYDIRLRAVEIGVRLAGMMPSEESKYRVEEGDEENGFWIPQHIENLSEAELLRQTQLARQRLLTGVGEAPEQIEPVVRGEEDSQI